MITKAKRTTKLPKARPKLPQDSSKSVAPASKPSTSEQLKKTKQPAQSKQARVLTLLERKEGATIVAVMKATGWQAHSVRGFLTGVVRNKLRLNLASEKRDGERTYYIVRKPAKRPSSRRRAG